MYSAQRVKVERLGGSGLTDSEVISDANVNIIHQKMLGLEAKIESLATAQVGQQKPSIAETCSCLLIITLLCL